MVQATTGNIIIPNPTNLGADCFPFNGSFFSLEPIGLKRRPRLPTPTDPDVTLDVYTKTVPTNLPAHGPSTSARTKRSWPTFYITTNEEIGKYSTTSHFR